MDDLLEHLRAVASGAEPARLLEGALDDLGAAYALQDRLADEGGPFCGWKIALNHPDQMASLGLAEPIFGRVVGAPLRTGAEVSLARFRGAAIEPEFAIVLGRDIDRPPSRAALRAAIGGMHAGFELLDRRGLAGGVHPPTFVANNVFNAGVVLGEAIPLEEVEAGYASRYELDGETLMTREGSAPEPPLDALERVVAHVLSRGHKLPAGSVVLCGAH